MAAAWLKLSANDIANVVNAFGTRLGPLADSLATHMGASNRFA
jgi:hypothetical protein